MARRRRKRKRIRLTHIVLLLITVYGLITMFNQRKLTKDLQGKKENLQEEISVLEKDINMLDDELEISDSLEFIEKVAREELGMVKPREIIYINREKIKNSFFDKYEEDSNWHSLNSNIY